MGMDPVQKTLMLSLIALVWLVIAVIAGSVIYRALT